MRVCPRTHWRDASPVGGSIGEALAKRTQDETASGSSFSRTFAQSQLHAASLFPSELSSCDQTTYNGTVILAMDQHYEAMNDQGS